jgi:hypothetical protein
VANIITPNTRFFIDAAHTRQSVNTSIPYSGINALDIYSWTCQDETLVMAANFFFHEYAFNVTGLSDDIVQVLAGNITSVNGTTYWVMPSNTIAGVIVKN